MIGAVTVGRDPKVHFRLVNWFKTKTFLGFLDQLISRYKNQKTHLVLDDAKYFKGPVARKWLVDKQAHIELHYLESDKRPHPIRWMFQVDDNGRLSWGVPGLKSFPLPPIFRTFCS